MYALGGIDILAWKCVNLTVLIQTRVTGTSVLLVVTVYYTACNATKIRVEALVSV